MKITKKLVLWIGLVLAIAAAPAQAQSTQCVSNAIASGTGNAITIPLLPCGTATNLLILTLSATNTTTSPTLQMVGYPALPILNADGSSPQVGELSGAGAVALLTGTGSSWKLLANGLPGVAANLAVVTVSSNATATALNDIIRVNATAAPVTIVVPRALGTSLLVKRIRVEKIDASANLVTIEDDLGVVVGYLVTPYPGHGGGWLDVEADGMEDEVYGVP